MEELFIVPACAKTTLETGRMRISAEPSLSYRITISILKRTILPYSQCRRFVPMKHKVINLLVFSHRHRLNKPEGFNALAASLAAFANQLVRWVWPGSHGLKC